MAVKVRDLNANKLFKIAKSNLRTKAKEWFKKLNPTPTNWTKLHPWIMQKYGNIDVDDIRLKLDAIKQELKERVQKYYERLDKFFQWGQIQDVEQRHRFLAKLRLEIRKFCVVKTYTEIEEVVVVVHEIEWVL
jgi:hypothetical protein